MSHDEPRLFPKPKRLTLDGDRCLEYRDTPRVRYLADPGLPAQGYTLEIDRYGALVRHSGPAGAFYAGVTLRQLTRQYEGRIPFVHIEDAPDFPKRGVLLDIGRDKIPTMESLYGLIDLLAGLKINQLHLYMEGYRFAYQAHRKNFPDETPISADEYRRLDAYARDRFIELVPTQNCFGHMGPWLALDEYGDLAENPDGFELIPGLRNPPSVLNPLDPRSLRLVAGLFDELLPNFTSPLVNICFDEPFELGSGKSSAARADLDAAARAKMGVGRIYLDFLEKVCSVVARHGRRPMVWGDVIAKHPELLGELPRDITILDWNYEGSVSFEAHCRLLREHNLSFYVCPGTSGWCSIAGRVSNMRANLLDAAEQGLKYGADGYLVTDWGDMGHWQVPGVSYPGYAYGAALSWNLSENRDADTAHYLDTFVFEDHAGLMGKMALALGDYSRFDGFYVFTFDSGEEGILVSGRMFAPAIGINEDPVTGNANSPIGAYLTRYGKIPKERGGYTFEIKQGEAIGRKGYMRVHVYSGENGPELVKISGGAVQDRNADMKTASRSAVRTRGWHPRQQIEEEMQVANRKAMEDGGMDVSARQWSSAKGRVCNPEAAE